MLAFIVAFLIRLAEEDEEVASFSPHAYFTHSSVFTN